MKRTSLVVAAAVAALSMVVAGCSTSTGSGSGASTTGANGKTLQTVKVGIVQLSIFAPVYVAQAKGYFAGQGIKVQLENVKSGQDAVPLAASGQLDAVAAGFSAGMFNAINTGLGVKVVGSMGVADGDAAATPTNLVSGSGISSISDLKGKKVAAAGGVGGTGGYLLGLALESKGLSINDVTIVNLGNPDMPTAIKNGSIAAAVVSAPFNKQAITAGGTSLWAPPAGTSGTGLLYGEKFAKSNLAQPFFDALAHGAKDLQGKERYSDANIKIIADATDQTPAKVRAVPLYTWEPNLKPLPDQLSASERIWMQAGAVTYQQPLDPSKYIDDSFAKKVPQ